MRYKKYLLIVLMAVWSCNATDNVALGLVMQDIKTELHLTDTQLGVLTGIAVGLFYAVMGIPIARWADRGNRVAILSMTAALWSILVALCGTATNFVQLMLLRAGVGIGEAGCAPTSQSLLAEHFSRAERPRATAIFLMGDALSMFVGFFIAGWIAQLYGWRLMFMLLGVPGVIAAIVVWFTLKEPRRAQLRYASIGAGSSSVPEKAEKVHGATLPGLVETTRTLWNIKTYRSVLLYFAVGTFFLTGTLQWQPAFLIRSYGLKTGELGTWLAVLYCTGVLVGRYWGGELASRFAANNERLQFRSMSIIYLIAGVLGAFIYIVPNQYLAYVFIGLSLIAMNLIVPAQYAAVQTLVPGHMRATSTALMFFCGALIGNGLGPLAAGALSDALRPHFGDESLRYASLALYPGYIWGAWYLWVSGRTVTQDIQRANDGSDRDPLGRDAFYAESRPTVS